jgi:hypothetical protein
MKVFFYLPKSAMNEATEYYCNLVIKAFKDHEIVVSEDSLVGENIDVIVTIRGGDQRQLKYSNKKKQYTYVNWFQGIGPEEYELLHNYTIRGKLGKYLLSFLEKRSIKKTDLCLLVSNEMKRFYENKYVLSMTEKSVIVPCYNKSLDESSFVIDQKYDNLSFVYAGAIYGWQCIEESLQIFKRIQDQEKSATLTLLTAQRKEAYSLIKKYNLENVTVGFVKLEQLQHELKKYKYGFLLRKDDPINNVATPTKMNSYLAAGIIPIYTDVVRDFEAHINLGEYSLKFALEKDSLFSIADRILAFDRQSVDVVTIKSIFMQIFEGYYSDEQYIAQIQAKINELNKNL